MHAMQTKYMTACVRACVCSVCLTTTKYFQNKKNTPGIWIKYKTFIVQNDKHCVHAVHG